MAVRAKKTITISLPDEELAELDRLRERQSLTRSEALREAVRWYIGVMRRLPAAEEPEADEVAALRHAQEEIARGGGRPLREVLRDLERHSRKPG
jgi:metal-responsive CopG/Arc/MetJ family transcriptional regulator